MNALRPDPAQNEVDHAIAYLMGPRRHEFKPQPWTTWDYAFLGIATFMLGLFGLAVWAMA